MKRHSADEPLSDVSPKPRRTDRVPVRTRAAAAIALSAERNPFVPIPYRWRVAVIVYAFVWRVLPLVVTAAFHQRGQSYVFLRVLLETTNEALLLVPFFLRTVRGSPVGWLHPLVFSTLFAYALAAVQNTSAMLYPFTVWFHAITPPVRHRLLHGWLAIDVAEAHVKGESLVLLSTISIYLGFLLFHPRVPTLSFRRPRRLLPRLLPVFLALVLLTGAVISSSGGLVEHITSFAQGRFRALGGLGHITAFIAFAPTLMAVWFVFDRSVFPRLWFLSLLGLSLGLQFATSGSRSATLMPVVLVASAWVYHHRRIPAARLTAAGLVAFVAVGVLGEIRTSAWTQRAADFSALTEFDLTESIKAADEELDIRNQNSAFLPTIAFVPDRVGLLWGRTYLGAAAFFIPRAIWSGKPRGAGAHAAAMIFHGMKSADGYEGGGIPPGPVAEAYWNFHVPGVIVVFMLFGVFQRWLAEFMCKHDGVPAAVGFFIVTLFYARSPSSDSAIALAQTMGPLLFVYALLGVLPLRAQGRRARLSARDRLSANPRDRSGINLNHRGRQ